MGVDPRGYAQSSTALLLRTTGACLQELSALHATVRQIADRLPESASPVAVPASPLAGLQPLGSHGHEKLEPTCVVEKTPLRDVFVEAFSQGEIGLELRGLVRKVARQGRVADELTNATELSSALLEEFRCGRIRAVALRRRRDCSLERLWQPVDVEAAITQEVFACENEFGSPTVASHGNAGTKTDNGDAGDAGGGDCGGAPGNTDSPADVDAAGGGTADASEHTATDDTATGGEEQVQAEAAKGGADPAVPPCADSAADEVVVTIFPTFRRLSLPLVEAILLRCQRERLATPFELLREAVAVLIPTWQGSDDFGLMALLSTNLSVNLEGRIFVSEVFWKSRVDEPSAGRPLPLYPAGRFSQRRESADTAPDDSKAFDDALQVLGPHLADVRLACGIEDNADEQHSPLPGILLGLLSVLPSGGLGLSTSSSSGAVPSCGALLWAYESTVDSGAPGDAPEDAQALQSAQPDDKPVEVEVAAASAVPASAAPAVAVAVAVAAPMEASVPETPQLASPSQPSPAMGETSDQPNRAPAPTLPVTGRGAAAASSSDVNPVGQATIGTTPIGVPGGDDEEEDQDEELVAQRNQAKQMFVECFKEDMLEGRQLLMSQINNLYKMRTAGKGLDYKTLGYEKLHDFLMDIPGLSVHGSGNRMEVKILDEQRGTFEAFCEEIADGADVPKFQKPLPVPESFQWRVIEVFRRCGSREIPAKYFRDLWNTFFPSDKLKCKDFGYRDVRGLLANISAVEKVGGKYNTKYVLRADIDIESREPPSPQDEEARRFLHQGRLTSGMFSGPSPPTSVAAGAAPSFAGGQSPKMGSPTVRAAGGLSTLPKAAPRMVPSQDSLPGMGSPMSGSSAPAFRGQLGGGKGAIGTQPRAPVGQKGTGHQQAYDPAPDHKWRQPDFFQMQQHPQQQQQPQQHMQHMMQHPQQQQQQRIPQPFMPPEHMHQNFQPQHDSGQHQYGHQQQVPRPQQSQQQQHPSQHAYQPFGPPQAFDQQQGFERYMNPINDAGGDWRLSVMRQGDGMDGYSMHQRQQQQNQHMQSQSQHMQQQMPQTAQQQPPPQQPPPPPPQQQQQQQSASPAVDVPQDSGLGMWPGMSVGDHEQPQLPRTLQGLLGDGPETPPMGGPSRVPFFGAEASIPPVAAGVGGGQPASSSSYELLEPADDGLKELLSRGLASRNDALGTRPAAPEIMPKLTGAPEDEPATMPATLEQPAKDPVVRIRRVQSPPHFAPSPPGLRLEPEPSDGLSNEPDQVAPLSAASEHRRLRKMKRGDKPNKGASFFLSSPGALSTEDRDASLHQGKFDLGALYQTRLRNDRYCMIVDFQNGRVLFSNALCDQLFENLAPLPQRDVVDLIHEEDRISFSASIMYLSLGKYTAMDPQEMRINAATGVKSSIVSGEQLVGCWWWLDFAFDGDGMHGPSASSTGAPLPVHAASGTIPAGMPWGTGPLDRGGDEAVASRSAASVNLGATDDSIFL